MLPLGFLKPWLDLLTDAILTALSAEDGERQHRRLAPGCRPRRAKQV